MSLEDVGEFEFSLGSHGGLDDLDQGGDDSVTFYSAVNASIHYELQPDRCISVDNLKKVIKSAPRRLPTTYPNRAADAAALYWMTPQTNRPAVVKLIGLLDTAGSRARTGPYFNMVNMDHVSGVLFSMLPCKFRMTYYPQITSAAFGKAKVVFEIRNLTDNDTSYSEEARLASQTVFGALRFLTQMQEKGRQPGELLDAIISLSDNPHDHPIGATINDIVYVNMSDDVCTISLHSDPIFKAPVEKKLASTDAEISLDEFERKHFLHFIISSFDHCEPVTELGKPGASSLVKPSEYRVMF